MMKFYLFTGAVILLFLSACAPPKYLSIPVDYDAKLSFKPDTTTIVLINQYDFSQVTSGTKRKKDALRNGAYAAIKYAGAHLSTIPHVKIINLVDSTMLKMNTDSIKTLALQYHSDYVLALKSFDAGIGLSDVQQYTASYNTNCSVKFILYEGNGLYSKILNGTADEPQSVAPNFGLLGNLLIHPTVGGNKQSVMTSAEHATEVAFQDYFPYTLTNNRPLYNDVLLEPMVNEILANHFDKAYALADPLIKGIDLKLASKAAYNLAVVYEAQGDIDLAIDMAMQSSEKNKNDYATILLGQLRSE